MKTQTYNEIIRKLEQELSLLKTQTQDFIELTEMAMGLCDKVIAEFREMVLLDGFQTDDEEIYFFKYIKPRVYSKLIFYTEVFNIETYRPREGKKEQIRYLKDIVRKFCIYLNENKEFYQYYRLNKAYSDKEYFLRGKADHRIHVDNIMNHVDPKFSTGYDHTLAKIIAYEQLKKYVGNEIQKIKGIVNQDSNLHWTGKKVDAVLLIYALNFFKIINNGQADIVEISRAFEKMFNLDLKNLYNIFTKEIKGKKKDRAEFLRKLLETFERRLDDLDK